MTDRLERTWHALDPQRLQKMLMEMIDIYSPAGKEEDVQLYLEDILSRAGYRCERQIIAEDEPERYNLRVTLGTAEPDLYLVGHVDTVHAWDLEEYGAREENGIIYGLGSADMKGGCAAMVETFLALRAALEPDEQPRVGLLLVVGEEENGDGSSRFLAERHPHWVVIGEPTGLSACFSHYGYLEAGFVSCGRRIHSSLPELGHNAVESMLRVLLHLGRDPLFDREQTQVVYSIREMRSSRAGFVVPDRCEAWIDLHLPPPCDPAEIEAAIHERAASAKSLVPGLDLEVSFDFASRGYDLGQDNLLAGLLKQVYPQLGRPLRIDPFRSHSDGNLFFEAGVKPLILGPGSLEVAHTPEEQTYFDQVTAAAQIYAAICLGFT